MWVCVGVCGCSFFFVGIEILWWRRMIWSVFVGVHCRRQEECQDVYDFFWLCLALGGGGGIVAKFHHTDRKSGVENVGILFDFCRFCWINISDCSVNPPAPIQVRAWNNVRTLMWKRSLGWGHFPILYGSERGAYYGQMKLLRKQVHYTTIIKWFCPRSAARGKTDHRMWTDRLPLSHPLLHSTTLDWPMARGRT